MGIFDKLFKKQKNSQGNDKQAHSNAAQKTAMRMSEKDRENKNANFENAAADVHTAFQVDILRETFQNVSPVQGKRNSEICNRFIAKGIADFTNNCFDEKALDDLSFDEFCVVYNNISWFVNNVISNIKEKAVSYKTFLRPKLLARLSTISIYTIYAKVTNLPFVMSDSAMLLYTDKEIAEMTVEKTNYDWIEIHEIKPDSFDSSFSEYYCTGYKNVKINGKTNVKMEDIYKTRPIESYGNTCVESCMRMVNYKQSHAMMMSNAASQNRSLTENEHKQLLQMSWNISQSLLRNTLLEPVETENGKIIVVNIPQVSFPNGKRFIGLFTDQWAINGYYQKNVSSAGFPELIRDEYNKIKSDPSIEGILINPGREEYMMTKGMLSQLFGEEGRFGAEQEAIAKNKREHMNAGKDKGQPKITEQLHSGSAQTDTGQNNENNVAGVIKLSDVFLKFREKVNTEKIYGEKLLTLISTYKALYSDKASAEEIDNVFAELIKEMCRTVYAVPFHYAAADEYQGDRVLHCTMMAADKINIDSIINRCQDMTDEQMSELYWVMKDNSLTIDQGWWDISRISGSEGFCFEENRMPKIMFPFTGANDEVDYFLCFTGIDQLLKVYGQESNLHIALFTIGDIVNYMASSDRFAGIIINPNTETHCFIDKRNFKHK